MADAQKTLTAQIRRLLDRLVAAGRLSKDDQEEIHDEVALEARALSREGILEALDVAIGNSKRRREEAVYIVTEWLDVPAVVDCIGDWMKGPDPQWRHWLIQIVGNRKLRQFAPQLESIIKHDPDDLCRDAAIHAAGILQSEECLPVLLQLAEEGDSKLTWRLATAFAAYGREDCKPAMERWFADTSQKKSTRIFAAWGLAKLEDEAATAYLIAMLDDPDERSEKHFNPGESLRAAQALCDVYGWPFEWHRDYVAETKRRVLESK